MAFISIYEEFPIPHFACAVFTEKRHRIIYKYVWVTPPEVRYESVVRLSWYHVFLGNTYAILRVLLEEAPQKYQISALLHGVPE